MLKLIWINISFFFIFLWYIFIRYCVEHTFFLVNGKLTKQPTEKVEIQTVTGDADVTIENLSQYKYIQITVTATSCYGGFVLIPVDYLLISGTNWGAVHSENIGSSNYFATCGYRFENSVCYIRNLRCGSGAANPRVIITGVK